MIGRHFFCFGVQAYCKQKEGFCLPTSSLFVVEVLFLFRMAVT